MSGHAFLDISHPILLYSDNLSFNVVSWEQKHVL